MYPQLNPQEGVRVNPLETGVVASAAERKHARGGLRVNPPFCDKDTVVALE